MTDTSSRQQGTVYVISDGTGETALTMTRAALVQYRDIDIHLVRCKNIRTEAQAESTLEQAKQRGAIIIHTVVSPTLRTRIQEIAIEKNLIEVDLLGPLFQKLDIHFGVSSGDGEAGLLRNVDEKYFRRIEAIEFTVKHDDGKMLNDLDQADIILVGVSRTSKTPLSIFLSHKGWKVANVPLVKGTPVPEELSKVDQRKVVGLIIDPLSLHRIRRNRLQKFGQDPGGTYARMDKIEEEIAFSQEVFQKNRRWPVFNVTDRALEEVASEIIRVVASRLGLKDVEW